VRVSADEAFAVVAKALNELGYSAQIPQLKKKPEIVPPRKDGTNYIARYYFNWWLKDYSMQTATAEVDATTKKLKSLIINTTANPKIWRDPPKIDVPPMLETNIPLPKPRQPAKELPTPSLPPATPIK
jgi:hypothetical protein